MPLRFTFHGLSMTSRALRNPNSGWLRAMMRGRIPFSAISACAIVLGATLMAEAQVQATMTAPFDGDGGSRLRTETARLYASFIAKVVEIVENDIRNDTGTVVIDDIRAGRILSLPSMDPETRNLVRELNIEAAVIAAGAGTDIGERIVVFVRDANLRQGVTRADIEREARWGNHASLLRLQNGTVTGQHGAVDLPAEASAVIGNQGIGSWVGINGNDMITSGANGSGETRRSPCGTGFHGTGIIEKRDIARATDLGGGALENHSDWTVVSRDCVPDRDTRVRFFGACAGPDEIPGTDDDDASGRSLYEATQFVRRGAANPFETEIFVDLSTAVPVGGARCGTSSRIDQFKDYLVNGRTHAVRELALNTATEQSDIGNGANRVPERVAPSGGARPVPRIFFPAQSAADFEFTRSCHAEYGDVALPEGFAGSNRFDGVVDYFRDYNRRETYFSDNRREYILNYDLVLDPNPYGHPAKGRKVINTTHGAAPDGDGWYKFAENCGRHIVRPERETRRFSCSMVHPDHPNGQTEERRDGLGHYRQTTADNPAPDGPTRIRVTWDVWRETFNDCHHIVEARTTETRAIGTTFGGRRCEQPQRRVRVVRTSRYLNGKTSIATTYDPNWTNNGGPTNCAQSRDGGSGGETESFDVDGDGIGDYSTEHDARVRGHKTGRTVQGGCGSCDGSNTGRAGGDVPRE